MFEEKDLWKQRLDKSAKGIGKYLRYILNGHLVIVLVFLIGGGSYYYRQWIDTLPKDFPAELIMTIVLALFLTHSPVYSLLLEGDKVFLLPLETKLKKFFRRNIFLSFFLQSYILILSLALFMPLYSHVNNGDYSVFFLFLLSMFAVKLFNLFIRWQVQFYVHTEVHRMDSLIRYFINGAFLYLLFCKANFFFLIAICLLYVILYFYYRSQNRFKGLNWEFLIEQEERRMMSFYRLANLFTDVPLLRERVKRRKWLDSFVSRIPFQNRATYQYIYTITFLRSGDYLGLFLRLTIIGIMVIYLFTYGYGQIAFILLFLFITGFQLLPMWKHHDSKIWIQLYPVEEKVRASSFQKLLFTVLTGQVVLLIFPLLLKGELLLSAYSFIAGIIFNYIFVYIYNKKKFV